MNTEGFVRLLRRMRHDYGNHFQVISGYLQLGMSQKALDYIQKINEEAGEERLLFESLPSEAALYFYEQLLSARDLGILLRYEDLEITEWKALQVQAQPLLAIKELMEDIVESVDEELVYLSIYENKDGWDLCFSCEKLPEGTRLVHVHRE
ncbi:MAG TPA: hypothetical protein GX404_09435 [Syntrophomonadaceae bacterium]|jgi:stage 0 sporulation protein B (sporulation initiation phosphotransferase)|nr:hypothetical protein [Syntrophomonadaceae bacterium]